jgi:hypothetical protein
MRPIFVDKNHCKIEDYTKLLSINEYGFREYKLKTVKCDWEFNPMYGMEECNTCGMTRG